MKRGLLSVAVTACLLAAAGLYGSGQPDKAASAQSSGARPVLEISIAEFYGAEPVKRPSLYEQEMLKLWDIKFNFQDIPNQGAEEKMNLFFASGEEPEVITHGPFGKAGKNRWGMDGHLVALSDYMDRLPEYKKVWASQAAWDFMYANSKAADGKLYYLPFKAQVPGMYSWIYRKGTLSSWGLSFPKSPNELSALCKEVLRRDPKAIPIAAVNALQGTLLGFEATFRTQGGFFIDPDTDKLAYGPQTDKYRDMLKYLNRLYADKLMDQEFLTVTSQQWTERYAQGLTYIQFHYGTRGAWANTTMAPADSNAGWDWSREWIDAYGKTPIALNDAPFFDFGPVIAKKASKEKLDRLLEYFNWSCTEPGIVFSNFGAEGVTYNYVSGVPTFTDIVKRQDNPSGVHINSMGFNSIYFIIRHPIAIAVQQGQTFLDVGEAIGKLPHFKNVAWQFTPEQDKKLVDLETVLNDVRSQTITKFIIGKLDPANDAQWKQFQDDLAKAGLEQDRAIRAEALTRSPVN